MREIDTNAEDALFERSSKKARLLMEAARKRRRTDARQEFRDQATTGGIVPSAPTREKGRSW